MDQPGDHLLASACFTSNRPLAGNSGDRPRLGRFSDRPLTEHPRKRLRIARFSDRPLAAHSRNRPRAACSASSWTYPHVNPVLGRGRRWDPVHGSEQRRNPVLPERRDPVLGGGGRPDDPARPSGRPERGTCCSKRTYACSGYSVRGLWCPVRAPAGVPAILPSSLSTPGRPAAGNRPAGGTAGADPAGRSGAGRVAPRLVCF